MPGHPLPLPLWSDRPQPAYFLANNWQFNELASRIEQHLQSLLEDHNYDTLGNLLDFYHLYKKRNNNEDLDSFYQRYMPEVTQEHHTCVGLALELWHRLHQLNDLFPHLSQCLYLVSCEENVDDCLADYLSLGNALDAEGHTLEKEHVLLALKVNIGGRQGMMVCDPGYHVARVVTVMQDKAYPHTGWFTQSNEKNLRRDYNYDLSPGNNYVLWEEKEHRNGIETLKSALIYVTRPYMTAVDVTERRNLVYDFRSLLSRDAKGHLVAGVYFKLQADLNNNASRDFTIFYQNCGRKRVKLSFDLFNSGQQIPKEVYMLINECNEQLNFEEGALLERLQETAAMMVDTDFLHQLLIINKRIGDMTLDN